MKTLMITLITIFAFQAVAEETTRTETITPSMNLTLEDSEQIRTALKKQPYNDFVTHALVDHAMKDGRFDIKSIQLTNCDDIRRPPHFAMMSAAQVQFEVIVAKSTHFGFSSQKKTYSIKSRVLDGYECKDLAKDFDSREMQEQAEREDIRRGLLGTDATYSTY